MITQELIFIIILAVFIGGMLWSDRDSRRWRFGEPFPPWSAARETLMAFHEFKKATEMAALKTEIMGAIFKSFILENNLNDCLLKQQLKEESRFLGSIQTDDIGFHQHTNIPTESEET